MPAVSQVGKLPGGGAFGLKHRKHAVTGGRIANAIPYVAMAPPYTNGTFDDIPVDDPKMPHAGRGEKVGRNAPEGPQSHHDGSDTRELALALDADLRKDFLPTVPIRRPHRRRKGAPLMAFRPPPLGWTPKDSRPSWKILSDSCRLTVGIAWIRWFRPRRPRG